VTVGESRSPAVELDGMLELAPRRGRALRPTALLLVAVLLVAANLRPAVTSLGSVLDDVHADLHASTGWVSVLTALPGLCFGLAGFGAAALAGRFGLARAIGLAMGLLAVGLLVRVLFGAPLVLVGTLVGCAGIAVCNVLLPVVVKGSFPLRIGLVTGLYTAVLQTGAASAALVTPQLDAAAGGWRPALGSWAVLAVIGFGFWALQSMFAYVIMGWLPQVLMDTAGVSRGEAGLMMAVANVIGLPLSLVVAPLAARRRSQSGWAVGITAVGGIGVLGLLLAPAAAPWLWAVCIGVGLGVFAIALALISLRTGSAADTRALSTMSQSTGYLLAAVGPLAVGVLRGASGSWSGALWLLLAGAVVQVVFGWLSGRDRLVGARTTAPGAPPHSQS
jgi:MFS transporter, CP family, cyanate transporter